MADVVDKLTRSRMMAGIRGKNTKPERVLRSALHSAGFRYRIHVSDLPGKPDLVFPKYKAIVLVHGCFWHRHADCWWSTNPSSNVEFWATKFDQNISRDAKNIDELRKLGWRVAVVWECAMRLNEPEKTALTLGNWLKGHRNVLSLPLSSKMRKAEKPKSLSI